MTFRRTSILSIAVCLLLVLAAAPNAAAAPCPSTGNYSALIALGTTGCTINDLLFNNFTLASSASGTGTLPTATQLTFSLDNPGTGTGTGQTIWGFEFHSNISVLGVGSVDILIQYDITAPLNVNEITSIHLLTASVTTAGGVATVLEADCGRTQTAGVSSGCGSLPAITTTFAAPHQDLLGIGPFNSVHVVKDINVLGNSAGAFAGISNVRDSVDESVLPTAPTIGKAFNPSVIAVGGTSTLTFTITGGASSDTNVGFTDTLPAGVMVATPNALAGNCGGTATATAGSGSISLSGANLTANATCTVSVNVAGTTPGPQNNTVTVTSDQGTGNTATATLSVGTAAPCSSVAPANYAALIALGSAGCTINDLLFNNFTLSTGAAGTGTLPTATQLTFSLDNPGTSTGTGQTIWGFEFNPNINVLGSGSVDILIQYDITAPLNVNEITSVHLLTTSVTAAGGVATVAEADCGRTQTAGLSSGCTFLPTITTTSAAPHQDLLGIGPFNSVHVVKDINVFGNSVGAAAGISNVRDSVDETVLPTAPTIGKSFNPSTIGVGGTSTLTFTITGGASSDTNVGFTDTLPAGVMVATPNALAGNCGGTATATAGSGSISLSGANLTANATCTVSVNVAGTTPGPRNNTVTVTSDQGTGNTATATLTVLAVAAVTPPTITKAFADSQLQLLGPGNSTSLSFTITNPVTNPIPLAGIAFSDTLPAGLIVSTPAGLTGSCTGGTITAVAGSNSISLSGATLAPGASCTFSVNVTALAIGVQDNTTSPVTSTTLGAAGPPATASTSVNDLFFFWFFAA